MTDYSDLKKAQRYLSEHFEGTAFYNKNKRNDAHLRVSSKFFSDKNNVDLIHNFIQSHEKNMLVEFNSIFSSSYKTFLLSIPEICESKVPIIFCHANYKKNIKDSVIQKQLTPYSLGVLGEFKDVDTLLNSIISGLKVTNPDLSSYWESTKENEFVDILCKLLHQAIDRPVSFDKREISIIKESSIGKDFGELLVALNILNKYGNVCINSTSNSSNYDLSYSDSYGIINKINVKSMGGSGQSFSSVAKYIDIFDSNDFIEGSKSFVLAKILRAISKKEKGKNKDTVFKIMEIGCSLDDDLGGFLNEVKKHFFGGNEFAESNYIPKETFEEFSELATSILEKFNLKLLGIPYGNNQKSTEYTYNKEDGKLNAILFYLLTNFARNFDQDIFSNLMKKCIKTDIDVVNVRFDNKGLKLEFSNSTNYLFHYWANFSAPLNNFLGFKVSYN